MDFTGCQADADVNIGEEINPVRSSFYEYGVRWACGRVQELPALPKRKLAYAPGGTGTARRRAVA